MCGAPHDEQVVWVHWIARGSDLMRWRTAPRREQEQREMKKAMRKLREAGAEDPNITAAAAITAAQAAAASAALNGGIPSVQRCISSPSLSAALLSH
jgi:hypothetical protein